MSAATAKLTEAQERLEGLLSRKQEVDREMGAAVASGDQASVTTLRKERANLASSIDELELALPTFEQRAREEVRATASWDLEAAQQSAERAAVVATGKYREAFAALAALFRLRGEARKAHDGYAAALSGIERARIKLVEAGGNPSPSVLDRDVPVYLIDTDDLAVIDMKRTVWRQAALSRLATLEREALEYGFHDLVGGED